MSSQDNHHPHPTVIQDGLGTAPFAGVVAGVDSGGVPREISVKVVSGVSAQAVAIIDGSGAQITSFGGGTQYTDANATPAHPTGTMPIFDNAGTLSKVSNAVGLPVNVIAGGTSGTQYADGAAAATPTGTQVNWNDSGTQRAASVAKPLPTAQQGNGAVGDNTATITTAGTAVQLGSNTCKRVFIQAHESNGGTVSIGASTVVAALSGRRGHTLLPTQGDWFTVSNTNLLYADSTTNGDKVHFYFES